MPPPEEADPGVKPRIRPFLGGHGQPREVAPTHGFASFPGSPQGDPEPPAGGLRPFVLTSGRVPGQDHDLELETQVTTSPGAVEMIMVRRLPRELEAIVMLCVDTMSVAEISAWLKLQLGVTKVLVGDLRNAGLLEVHATDSLGATDSETIMRVMHGLRAIS